MVADVQQSLDLSGRFNDLRVWREYRDGDCWSFICYFGGPKCLRHMFQLSDRDHDREFKGEVFSADPDFLRGGSVGQHDLVLLALRLGAGLLVLLHPATGFRGHWLLSGSRGHPDVPGDEVLTGRGSGGVQEDSEKE